MAVVMSYENALLNYYLRFNNCCLALVAVVVGLSSKSLPQVSYLWSPFLGAYDQASNAICPVSFANTENAVSTTNSKIQGLWQIQGLFKATTTTHGQGFSRLYEP